MISDGSGRCRPTGEVCVEEPRAGVERYLRIAVSPSNTSHFWKQRVTMGWLLSGTEQTMVMRVMQRSYSGRALSAQSVAGCGADATSTNGCNPVCIYLQTCSKRA
jgi:hypothetical protein